MDKPKVVVWLSVLVFCLIFWVGIGLVIAALSMAPAYMPEDVNRDGAVNVLDVQQVVNAYLGP